MWAIMNFLELGRVSIPHPRQASVNSDVMIVLLHGVVSMPTKLPTQLRASTRQYRADFPEKETKTKSQRCIKQ
jgi:hypothetical protein